MNKEEKSRIKAIKGLIEEVDLNERWEDYDSNAKSRLSRSKRKIKSMTSIKVS